MWSISVLCWLGGPSGKSLGEARTDESHGGSTFRSEEASRLTPAVFQVAFSSWMIEPTLSRLNSFLICPSISLGSIIPLPWPVWSHTPEQLSCWGKTKGFDFINGAPSKCMVGWFFSTIFLIISSRLPTTSSIIECSTMYSFPHSYKLDSIFPCTRNPTKSTTVSYTLSGSRYNYRCQEWHETILMVSLVF